MANTYSLVLTDGTLDFQIEEGTVVDAHGLRFDGFQKPAYGDRRNNNLLRLLTNFASPEDPGNPGNPSTDVIPSPLVGQFWFNTTTATMLAWNGSAWVVVNSDLFTLGGPFSVLDGTPSNQLTLTKNGGADIVIDNVASENDLNDHIATPTGAHPSSGINFDDAPLPFTAATLQVAVTEVSADITDHRLDAVDAHDAEDITFSDASVSFTASDVQTALEEIEADVNAVQSSATTAANNLANHIADPTDAHDASAISYDNNVSGYSATDVQDALIELNNDVSSTSGQSVVDSVRVTRSGIQNASSNTFTKIGFNNIQFGDDQGQFNDITNRYTASFDQIVRVRVAMGINSITDESRLELQIRKNNVVERSVEEWIWSESSAPPGDIECSCILELNDGDYVEGWFNRYGSGTVSVDTLASRTALEIDVIKATGTVPPISDVQLNNHTFSTVTTGPAVNNNFTLTSDGDFTTIATTTSPAFASNEWHVSNPSPGIGNTFQARLVPISGTLDTGLVNTWQTLSANRTYGFTSSTNRTFQGTLQIRDTATLTIQDQCSITIQNTFIGKP